MAVLAQRVVVTSDGDQINTFPDDNQAGSSIAMKNTGTVSVFIGGETVNAENGLEIPPGEWGPSLDLGGGERVYAVTAEDPGELSVIESGI